MYKIIFEDNTEFIGGTLHNSNWNKITNIPIKKLEYYLLGKVIILENFELYNHLIERISIINTNQEIISKLILMGKKEETVITYTYDFIKKNGYFGSELFGREYLGKPTTGWKKGILHQNPTFKIL